MVWSAGSNPTLHAEHDDAALVIGVHEKLPEGAEGLLNWFDKQRIYRKSGSAIDGMNE